MANNRIEVHIKRLSGEVFTVEIDSKISHSDFIFEVSLFVNIRSVSQLSIYREFEDEFILIQPSEHPLLPKAEEIFSVYIDPSTYSTRISLASTDSWNKDTRYQLFVFNLHEYNGSIFRNVAQGIYTLPNTPDTTPENILFFLENDQIPTEQFGRFGDEWEIHIPQDMVPLCGIKDLVNHSPLGDGLSDIAKERIVYMFSEKFNQYLDIEFNRDTEETDEDL
jgi:hypothetical protein